jgi:hypothetical protein
LLLGRAVGARILICAALAFSGCLGDVFQKTPAHTQAPAPEVVIPPTPFSVPHQELKLLPFEARLSKLEAVTGVPASDPIFAELIANRQSLGDYDYANGIKPDNTWSASKLVQWVVALKPVCSSSAVQQRYPDLPQSLPALIEAAYGRPATAADLAAAQESLEGLTVDADARHQAICLAVLSSLEFLAP